MAKEGLAQLEAEGAEHGGVGQGAEREHHAGAGHGGEFAGEELIAGAGLGRGRQVGGGDAAYGVDDAAILQREAIRRVGPVFARREAGAQQRLIQQDARVVAGERAPGAVRTADARRHADHQQAGVERAPTRHGGVEPAGVGGAIGGAVPDQAGA